MRVQARTRTIPCSLLGFKVCPFRSTSLTNAHAFRGQMRRNFCFPLVDFNIARSAPRINARFDYAGICSPLRCIHDPAPTASPLCAQFFRPFVKETNQVAYSVLLFLNFSTRIESIQHMPFYRFFSFVVKILFASEIFGNDLSGESLFISSRCVDGHSWRTNS